MATSSEAGSLAFFIVQSQTPILKPAGLTFVDLRSAEGVHEETKAWGYGAEIAARIGEELFEWLDAPVRRVAALDSFVAYHPTLEDVILPQVADVQAALDALVSY